jgi:hypothetical protein
MNGFVGNREIKTNKKANKIFKSFVQDLLSYFHIKIQINAEYSHRYNILII